MIPSVTGKEMCEIIARWLKEARGLDIRPEEIWAYSPTGELAMLFDWYDQALDFFAKGDA